MIKQLIGVLVTLCVLAVVVLTVLHRDRYVSMLHFGDPEVSLSAADTLPVPVPTQPADTAATDGRSIGSGAAAGVAPVVRQAETPAADSVSASRGGVSGAADSVVGRSSDGTEIRDARPADGAADATSPTDTVNRQKRPTSPRS